LSRWTGARPPIGEQLLIWIVITPCAPLSAFWSAAKKLIAMNLAAAQGVEDPQVFNPTAIGDGQISKWALGV